MFDIYLVLENRPGALAALGEALGAAGVSVEGGGVFASGAAAHAHFLVHDPAAARQAAETAGVAVTGVREVLVRRLDQARPGQLGAVARALGDAGVNIEVLYSDHANRLILVTDDAATAADATLDWSPTAPAPAGAG